MMETTSRFHHHQQQQQQSSSKLSHSSSLHDTSTATTESWSSVSGGRRTPQQQIVPSLPSNYSPKTRRQSFQQQSHPRLLSVTNPSSRSVLHVGNGSSSSTPSPLPCNATGARNRRAHLDERQLPELRYQQSQPHHHYQYNQSQPPRITRSEPGQVLTSSSMDEYVHRIASMSLGFPQLQTAASSREAASPQQPRNSVQTALPVSERIRQFNRRYPDMEPAAIDDDEGSDQSYDYAEVEFQTEFQERLGQRAGRHSYYRQSSASEQRQTPSPAFQLDDHEDYQPLKRFKAYAEQSVQPTLNRMSPNRMDDSDRARQRGPRRSIDNRAQPRRRGSASEASPSVNSRQSSDHNIETPSPSTVKDLKRQLWNQNEKLHATPAIRSYHQSLRPFQDGNHASESISRRNQRDARSLSPSQQRVKVHEIADPNQRFKSKFYEAAIAARLRGKVHPSDLSGPPIHRQESISSEVDFRRNSMQQSNGNRSRQNSFSERSRYSDSSGVARSEGQASVSHLKAASSNLQSTTMSGSMHGERNCRTPEPRRMSLAALVASRPPASPSWVTNRARDSYEKPSSETGIYERNLQFRKSPSSFVTIRGSDGTMERQQNLSSNVEREQRGRGTSVEPLQRNDSMRGQRSASSERPSTLGERAPKAGFGMSTSSSPPPLFTDRSRSPIANVSSAGESRSWHASFVPLGQAPSRDPSPRRLSGSWKAREPNGAQNEETIQDRRCPSPSTQNGTLVASLVAKLNAVKRDCPSKALAEIDSILRDESRSSSGAPDVPKRSETDERIATEDSDAESSLSSITNPTFQSIGASDMTQVQDKNSLGVADNKADPFIADSLVETTASLRHPQTSTFQGYASANQEIDGTPAESSYRIKETMDMAFTNHQESTISLDETVKLSTKPETRITVIQGPDALSSNIVGDITSSRGTSQTASLGHKLDNFMANAQELAEKIRVWDEMSAAVISKSGDSAKNKETSERRRPASPDGTEELGSIMTPIQSFPLPNPPNISRRPHPWDGPMQKHQNVTTKDTSMDDGAGIELQLAPQNRHSLPYTSERSQQERNGLIVLEEPHHGTNSTPGFVGEKFAVDHKLVDAGRKISSAFCGRHQQNANRISDNFDAAWVAMPSSAFFPEVASVPKQRSVTPQKQRPASLKDGRYQRSSSFEPNFQNMRVRDFGSLEQYYQNRADAPSIDTHPGIEVSLLNPNGAHLNEGKCAGRGRGRDGGSSATKRRGFLRSLLTKKKGFDHEKSRSLTPSRRCRDPFSHHLPESDYSNGAEMGSPSASGRSKSAGRAGLNTSRSPSSERFRSASMAQKFGRVMRLYDHD